MAGAWEKTVTVAAGRYTRERAALEAKRLYGDEYTAVALIAEDIRGKRWVYEVGLERGAK